MHFSWGPCAQISWGALKGGGAGCGQHGGPRFCVPPCSPSLKPLPVDPSYLYQEQVSQDHHLQHLPRYPVGPSASKTPQPQGW